MKHEKQLSEGEISKRMDAALKRALTTPPIRRKKRAVPKTTKSKPK